MEVESGSLSAEHRSLDSWRRWWPDLQQIRRDRSGEVAWYFTYAQFSCVIALVTGLLQLGVIIHHTVVDDPAAAGSVSGLAFAIYASRIQSATVFRHWEIVTACIFTMHMMQPLLYSLFVRWLISSRRAEDPHEGQYNTYSVNCIDTNAHDAHALAATLDEQHRGRFWSMVVFLGMIATNIGVNYLVFQYLSNLNSIWVTMLLGAIAQIFQVLWIFVCLKTTQMELHRTSTTRNNWSFGKVFGFSVATVVILLWLKQLFRIVLNPAREEDANSASNLIASSCVMDNVTNDFQVLLLIQFLTSSLLGFLEPAIYKRAVAWLRTKTRWAEDIDDVSWFSAANGYANLLYREFLLLGSVATGMHIGFFVFAIGLLDVMLTYVRVRYRYQAFPERLQNDYTSILWKANLALWIVAAFLPPTGAFHILTGRTTSVSCVIWQHNSPPL
jgi:hypothetical protein